MIITLYSVICNRAVGPVISIKVTSGKTLNPHGQGLTPHPASRIKLGPSLDALHERLLSDPALHEHIASLQLSCHAPHGPVFEGQFPKIFLDSFHTFHLLFFAVKGDCSVEGLQKAA